MNRLLAARGIAGELLNRIDNISNRQGARSVQLQADRSRAEDLDLVQAISGIPEYPDGLLGCARLVRADSKAVAVQLHQLSLLFLQA